MRCLGPDKLRLLASPCVAASLACRRTRCLPCLQSATASSSPITTSSRNGPESGDADGGIRFVYEPPRRFTLGALRKRRQSPPTSAKPRVDLLVEGNPLGTSPTRVDPLAEALRADAAAALQAVLRRKALISPGWKMPRVALLSLVLCDDPHIRELNSRHRGKDAPTDVLSFEMDDDLDYRVHLPVKLMGDLVVSLDTAERQAAERGHSLLDECRILLVHGLLHLAGFDHERGREAHEAMAEEERAVLSELGWRGLGLIAAADNAHEEGADEGGGGKEDGPAPPAPTAAPPAVARAGAGIVAGAGAGFLWQALAGGGKAEEEAEGRAAAATPRARKGEGASTGTGGGARERAAGQRPAPSSRQRQPSPPPSPQQQQQPQQRAGRGKGGGGGGSGVAPSRGGRGGGAAARAFAEGVAAEAAGPASSGRWLYGTASVATAGNSIPLTPWARPLLMPGTGGGGRWLYGGARSAAAAIRCFCGGGGGDGPEAAGGGGAAAAAATSSCSTSASAVNAVVASDSDVPEGSVVWDGGDGDGASTSGSDAADTASAEHGTGRRRRRRTRDIAIVALDLDGTLLDSRSRILPSSVAAIRAAAAEGVAVVAATGKARPAALAAAASAGLAAPGLLVWNQGPGVFLQGLAVHGQGGRVLSDSALPHSVVEAAYRYSASSGVSLCAFLGDTCAAPFMTPQLRELHDTYYEPLAEVVSSASSLLAGPPVRKLLFMSDPGTVAGKLLPYWTSALEGSGAQVMQAVPNMLEIVPAGVNKWAGVVRLLDHLGLPPSALMAVGDGGNDLEMVAGAGVGVAMGNAVTAVRAAAAAVVAGHDEGGVAEAFERFVL